MTAADGRRSAPDLFTALDLEGGPKSANRGVEAVPVDVDIDEDVTAPRDLTQEDLGGIADMLEPGPPKPRPPGGLADDELTTQPVPKVSAPILDEPSAPLFDADVDDELGKPRRRIPWGFVAMTAMMGGALIYVLLTQTDLMSGDVIAKRDAEVKAQAEAELAAIKAEQDRNKKEYGTIQLNSTPDGARVWLVQRGPQAVFETLPRGNEYHVFVDAPGHVPQVVLVTPADLGAPLQVDLEPIPPPAPPAPGVAEGATGTGAPSVAEAPTRLPLPDLEPAPKVNPQADPEDVVSLTVRSKTPQATIGLHVGYTPGATLTDLDVANTYDLRITKTGYDDHTILIKGRHWEQSPAGELVYMESIALVERIEPVPELPGDDVVVVEDEPPPEVKPKKKKRRKKRRRKKRRRKRG